MPRVTNNCPSPIWGIDSMCYNFWVESGEAGAGLIDTSGSEFL